MDEHVSAEALEDEARELGRQHGHSAGTWVIDGNTSEETAKAIIDGYEAGDPQVMDIEPSPLSGEWADDPTPASILRELDVELGDDEDWLEDMVLNAYEEGFSQAYWDEVVRAARGIL